MRQVKACGVLVFRDEPARSFLLLKHPHRYDLPKGHVEGSETELECALRELYEETGIPKSKVRLDERFRYQETYYPRYRKFGGERVEKTLIVFMGELLEPCQIRVAEHASFEWLPWSPPHKVQRAMVDPLLRAIEHHRKKVGLD